MKSIVEIRSEIKNVNIQILEGLRKRRELIDKVKLLKQCVKSHGNYPLFDSEREKGLFKLLANEFENMEIEDIYFFSLLMEKQMGKGYPKWSEGEHLLVSKNELRFRINPYIAVSCKGYYGKGLLKDEFKKLI